MNQHLPAAGDRYATCTVMGAAQLEGPEGPRYLVRLTANIHGTRLMWVPEAKLLGGTYLGPREDDGAGAGWGEGPMAE